jgi:endonuclease-3
MSPIKRAKKSGRARHAEEIMKRLHRLYPDAHCELDFKNPLELAIATILSAQCTDKRVNQVTPALFAKYQNVKDYARAELSDIELMIRPTGFFRSKALSIQKSAKTLIQKFNGEMPKTMKDLVTLRGVARKTANVILGTAFGLSEGIVVDTHVKRVSFRLGLTRKINPVQIEKDLMPIIPQKDWIFFGHAVVRHGRRVCVARKPKCGTCFLNSICPHARKSVQ